MHAASAAVAGGSIRAMEAILRGDVEHAFHPGGGLHHAMRARASGFCIYNDPALAIARARQDGLRVFYIDLDVHHGDGVQALFWDDPGVLTFSIHETGRALFPGTGEAWEIGEGRAAGTSLNVPLWPGVGERAWLGILRDTLPVLAASFGPDLIVSQHGADSHAWDPLAHLNVTTTAHGEAARLVDEIAHRHARGRWLATGGGGYDAYRVVPRTWALTWLAGSHREVPAATHGEWRDLWADEAARYGQAPLPETFDDAPNAGLEFGAAQETAEQRSLEVGALVRRVLVPRLPQVAADRGWWDPRMTAAAAQPGAPDHAKGSAVILPDIDADAWSRLTLAPWVIPPAAPSDGHAIVLAGLRAGARIAVAAAGPRAVGVAMIVDGELLAIGVAPDHRRQGLGRALIEAVVPELASAVVTVAERDPFDPLPASERIAIARRLLESAGLQIESADADLRSIDPSAIVGLRR
jgi:acetoin utilization protein AcuC